ncbi:hypothetical protein [Leptospira weilii]|nr:hypothetical protein [Leptospira weilii]
MKWQEKLDTLRNSLSLAKTKMTEVESKIADACDKMKGFEKKELKLE